MIVRRYRDNYWCFKFETILYSFDVKIFFFKTYREFEIETKVLESKVSTGKNIVQWHILDRKKQYCFASHTTIYSEDSVLNARVLRQHIFLVLVQRSILNKSPTQNFTTVYPPQHGQHSQYECAPNNQRSITATYMGRRVKIRCVLSPNRDFTTVMYPVWVVRAKTEPITWSRPLIHSRHRPPINHQAKSICRAGSICEPWDREHMFAVSTPERRAGIPKGRGISRSLKIKKGAKGKLFRLMSPAFAWGRTHAWHFERSHWPSQENRWRTTWRARKACRMDALLSARSPDRLWKRSSSFRHRYLLPRSHRRRGRDERSRPVLRSECRTRPHGRRIWSRAACIRKMSCSLKNWFE